MGLCSGKLVNNASGVRIERRFGLHFQTGNLEHSTMKILDTLRDERERQTRVEQERRARSVADQNIRNIEAAYRLGRQHQVEDDEDLNRR